MSQADSPNTTSLSRRAVLAGISVAAAPMVAAVEKSAVGVAASVDPIFGVIEAHHQAMRHETSCGQAVGRVEEALPEDRMTWHFMDSADRRTPPNGCADAPEWIKVQQDMSDAYARRHDAIVALLATEPTSLAGAIALLDYVGTPEYPWDSGGPADPILFGVIGVIGSIDERIAPAALAFPNRLAATMRRLIAIA
jgi:hypothetical protein